MTDIDWDELRAAATEAMQRAYAPYSRFKVGAAALVSDGRIVSGCNIENASYGVTLCAECSLVSDLFMSGGGKLVAFVCVDGDGAHAHAVRTLPAAALRARDPRDAARDRVRHPHDRRGAARRLRPARPRRGVAMSSARPARRPGASSRIDAVDVIRAKRDGGAVPEDALRWMIDAYTRGYVADAQMAAFAMAVLLNGMTRDEIRVMTDAMIASGERMSFAGLGKPTVDKHSTGGVGDKITLPLAPLVAAFGVAVPQLSGRGLGHTGGTLDKLESIPGWRAALSNDELFDAAARRRRGDLRRRLGPRAGRQEALRAARRHRHRRGDPADRLEHHVEEDRRGHRLRSCST